MHDQRSSTRRARAEAQTWFKKLSTIPVSNEDIWAYGAWCRDPVNRAAYNRVEARSRKVPDQGLFTENEILAALERRPDLARAYRAEFKRRARPAELKDIARELAIRVGLP
jgi:transmembrane sensor